MSAIEGRLETYRSMFRLDHKVGHRINDLVMVVTDRRQSPPYVAHRGYG
jgi:hypothetical protein